MRPVSVSKMRVILEWGQSPSFDVVEYRLYYSKQGEVSYRSPFCSIPKPQGNRPTIKYNLVECAELDGFNGPLQLAVASVDAAGNISDLSDPVDLQINFDSVLSKVYRWFWEKFA